jgi:NAD(P)-dependent dehydrogenase (short-subunit alcohol dehydrogenase family)
MALLEGKVAVVTGAGRGIGRAEAICLAAHGASVIVNDIGVSIDGSGHDESPAEEVVRAITSTGGKAAVSYDDVSTFAGAESLIQQAIDAWGDINIVVNNAGILRDKIIWNMTEDDFDSVVRVHLKGTFSTIKHAVTHWRSKHKAGEPVYGRIVNTASAAMLGNPGQANYSAAKGAIASLTLTVAVEAQSMGVTCNAIRPSAATRMTQMVSAEMREGSKDGFDARDPKHVGEFVSYLASPAAQWISGQVFSVYGDRVFLNKGWHNAAKMESPDKGWTAQDLTMAVPKLAGMAPVSMMEQLVAGQ